MRSEDTHARFERFDPRSKNARFHYETPGVGYSQTDTTDDDVSTPLEGHSGPQDEEALRGPALEFRSEAASARALRETRTSPQNARFREG